jgi:septal ring factor EnvC (AmiA/AmiB activator)
MTEEERQVEHRDTPRRLSPGNWIAIWTISATIIGSIIGVALGEHNRRIGGIESDVQQIETNLTTVVAGQAELRAEVRGIKGRLDAVDERLGRINQRFDEMDERFDRLEASIEQLLQLHLAAE